MSECPPAGFYHNVDDAEYRAWDAVNASSLRELERSPAHYFYAASLGEGEKTDDMVTGTIAHLALFQPDVFADRVRMFLAPINPRTGKQYGAVSDAFSQAKAEFTDMNRGKIIVTAQQFQTAINVARAARSDPAIAGVLACEGRAEVSMVWEDKDSGLRCKGRVDWLADGLFLDLKTTENAGVRGMSASSMRYGYFTQAAFYADGLRALGKKDNEAWIVAVEKSEPWVVGRYRMSPVAMEYGRKAYKGYLKTIAECRQSGVWPGYADGELSPPDGVVRELADE